MTAKMPRHRFAGSQIVGNGPAVMLVCSCGATARGKYGSESALRAFDKHVKRATDKEAGR